MDKIGVFICECGPNIKDAMDLGELVEFASNLENVTTAKVFNLLCSEQGEEFLKNEIKENNLTRVVIAACSPKEHEHTFKRVLQEAGLNPYLLQIANIREQCAWVVKDKYRALEKAKALVRAAVKRIIYHEPLEAKEIECQIDALVVGAGMAGISAALTLAQKNRKVYLVEKLPCIGGRVARYEEVFPNLECASCMLEPMLDEVLHNENIELLTFSEVQEVLGFYGDFVVKVEKKARYVDFKACIGCGACFEVCPVKVKNEFDEGLSERKAIYVPYAGALPNVPVIDRENCLRFQNKDCDACQKACPFGAINYEEKNEIRQLKVGAIVLATGFDVFDPQQASNYGYGKIDNVYTGLEFERLLSSTGPTGGQILLKNGQSPKSIALIHCVGSRTEKFNEYCSGICCTYLSKFVHLAKKKLPDVSVVNFYSDFCLPGKGTQGFFNKLNGMEGVEFLQTKNPDSIQIADSDGKISIKYTDIQGKSQELTSDMVILAPAIEAAKDAEAVAKTFDITQGKDRFFLEEHTKLAPVSTLTEGVFIAGCAQGPMDIQSAVAQGQAAAGRVLSKLIPGEKLSLEPITAVVDKDLCSGCKICVSQCPYKAVTYNEKEKHAEVSEVLCRGCGVCVAACPSGAVKCKHFTDNQILEEVKGVVE